MAIDATDGRDGSMQVSEMGMDAALAFDLGAMSADAMLSSDASQL